MTVVLDASVVVSALIDNGPVGRWAEGVLSSGNLAAPHLMPVEVSNILRRAVASGRVPADTAGLAHADLIRLRVALFSYEPYAPRVWELGLNVTSYDAWYVAVAEALGAPLATLDGRLARATGPRCEFRRPEGTEV